MLENAPPRDQDPAELQLLYSVSVQDIAFFKQQQWSLTNYVLLVQAALFGVTEIPELTFGAPGRWLFASFVAITAALGLFLLSQLHGSIEARRERLKRVRSYFGENFKNAWSVSKELDHTYLLLAFTQLVAAGIVSWLILVR